MRRGIGNISIDNSLMSIKLLGTRSLVWAYGIVMVIVMVILMVGSAVAFTNGSNYTVNDKGDTIFSTTIPMDTVNGENRVFQSLDFLTHDGVYSLIDSLLDLKKIPTALLKEIELFVAAKYAQPEPVVSMDNTNMSYPAQKYYNKWDTYNTHPYSEELSKHDTSIELVLQTIGSPYVSPIIGPITSYFGDGRNHSGMDIDLQVWDTVVSAFDGVVRISRKHGGYGRVVVVRHNNGLETLYAHLHRLKVVPGDVVKAGQLIGLGGSSGYSSGSHLHFECRFKGKPLNPSHFINYRTDMLVADTITLVKTRWSYSAVPKGVKYHRVADGEFLYLIAKRYGTSINRICDLNGIRRNSILRVGQRLRII
ncbi:MAG TPA: LysM peptidoglycan-binding domain-containing protein [Flavobacteriales bacterium]|nr:LysM peptidoglycan-binding domain-containing protein [Flavobacteriales bacterium]